MSSTENAKEYKALHKNFEIKGRITKAPWFCQINPFRQYLQCLNFQGLFATVQQSKQSMLCAMCFLEFAQQFRKNRLKEKNLWRAKAVFITNFFFTTNFFFLLPTVFFTTNFFFTSNFFKNQSCLAYPCYEIWRCNRGLIT